MDPLTRQIRLFRRWTTVDSYPLIGAMCCPTSTKSEDLLITTRMGRVLPKWCRETTTLAEIKWRMCFRNLKPRTAAKFLCGKKENESDLHTKWATSSLTTINSNIKKIRRERRGSALKTNPKSWFLRRWIARKASSPRGSIWNQTAIPRKTTNFSAATRKLLINSNKKRSNNLRHKSKQLSNCQQTWLLSWRITMITCKEWSKVWLGRSKFGTSTSKVRRPIFRRQKMKGTANTTTK